MKLNIADIFVNIFDGFAKYHQTSLVTTGLFIGSAGAFISMAAWPQMFATLAAGAGVLGLAWFAGKPK